MHLFVTGGTGFFGKALLRFWKKNPHTISAYKKIILLSRNPEQFTNKYADLLNGLNVSLHKGDIMLPSTLPSDDSITHVIHAATDSTFGPQLAPLDRYRQIVDGTQNLLDFAVNYKIQKFLLTSSGGVYGPQPQDMEQIPETYCGMPDPLDPNAAYSVGKRAAEHMCALYSQKYGIDFVVARCFAFVGQDLPLDVHFAIGNFIRDALYGEEIVVGGNGQPVRSYLHQDDLAEWLMVMLEKGKANTAYNLGSDEAITIADLAHLVRDLICPHKKVSIKGEVDFVNKKNRYVPNINKPITDLGLTVKVQLSSAILKSVESMSNG
jgi:UDP-glucuronate decarboxylase